MVDSCNGNPYEKTNGDYLERPGAKPKIICRYVVNPYQLSIKHFGKHSSTHMINNTKAIMRELVSAYNHITF